MKIVYTSRTGNVETMVKKLGATDVVKLSDGNEKVEEDYILLTFTTGRGMIPPVVDKFLESNAAFCKGVAASGNSDRFPDSFAQSADKIHAKYGIPMITKFDLAGEPDQTEEIKVYIASLA